MTDEPRYECAPGWQGPQFAMKEPLLCLNCGMHMMKLTSVGFGPGTTIEMVCTNCKLGGVLRNHPVWRGYEMTAEEVDVIFKLAGIDLFRKWELPNHYWSAPVGGQAPYPWWLVKTRYGLIEIGWRKRVISICWDDTSVRHIVTPDEVTKGMVMVHAYSLAKATEYLTEWQAHAVRTNAARITTL